MASEQLGLAYRVPTAPRVDLHGMAGVGESAELTLDNTDQTVTITGPWLQPEDGVFRSVLAYFADATGAEVIYTGSDS